MRRLKRRLSHGTLILVYHRINDAALDPWALSVRPDHFAEHLAVLQRLFHPISLKELAQSLQGGTKLKPNSVVITFDDGYADNLHNAKPILERFDCPATIFLVTGVIGSPAEFWWDELSSLLLQPHPLPEHLQLSIQGKIHTWHLGSAVEFSQVEYARCIHWRAGWPAPSFRHDLYWQIWQLMHPLSTDAQNEVMNALRTWADSKHSQPFHRILDQKECLDLAQAEQIEIGAHTIHHASLAPLPHAVQCSEISGSKRDLESLLNRPAQFFSYPFGKHRDYTPETIALVRESGFLAACSNESGFVNIGTDPFQLPRVYISDCSGAEFEHYLLSKTYV
jgi:peptidoglycan/xylan/chitin deacetylase (PgdA/CDA1 family)